MKRRRYLSLLGAAGAAGLTGCSGAAELDSVTPGDDAGANRTGGNGSGGPRSRTITPERQRLAALESAYDTVAHLVDDLGCDPTGAESCVAAVANAAGDDTLLVVPEGRFLVDGRLQIADVEHFAIYGRPGATFVAPPDHNGDWLVVDWGTDLLVEGFDVDVRAANAAPSLQFGAADDLVVRDVEVIGRGMRDDSEPGPADGHTLVGNALLPIVRSPDGTGLVENFVARSGGRIGTYNGGEGRVGIFVGRSNVGTIRIVDCRLEEFPNNGIYASRTNGVVQVEGGVYRNNDVSQVRLGTEGSYVDGTTMAIDTTAVRPPNRPRDYMYPRGVRIESGSFDTAGVVVRDVDVTVTHGPGPAIAAGHNGGRFAIRDSHVRYDGEGGAAIIGKPPTGGGNHGPPPRPYHGRIENVTVTGTAAGTDAVRLVGRPASTVEHCRLSLSGTGTNGVRLERSPGSTVRDTGIRVERFPLVVEGRAADGADCLVELIEEFDVPFSGGDRDGRALARVSRSGTFCVGPAA
ncbi:MAG: hypothetical protein ABEJ31_04405, partial [Haloarculaceae archaeon]